MSNFLTVGVKTDKLMKRISKMREQIPTIEKAVQVGVFKAALIVRNDMISRILKGPKTGHTYHRKGRGTRSKSKGTGRRGGGGGVDHQASAPGEAPANDSGNLARSINVVAGREGKISTAIIEIRTEYALPLEYGTKDIEPRPFAYPALNDNKELITDTIKAEVDAAIKAGA